MPFSQSWLETQSVNRIILVEVNVYDVLATTDITMYFSNASYMTTDGSISFNPVIDGDITLNEKISSEGGVAMSFGDIELINPNGELDSYLDSSKYIWTNREIKVYYGDPSWSTANISQIRTDFLKIFDGIVDDIDSRDRFTINIKIRDKLERLNSTITENKLGTYGAWAGGQQNQDSIIPLIFGEVHNITPLLINPAYLEYQYNDGNSEQVIEIRDNGVPVYTFGSVTGGAEVATSTGKFKLNFTPAGTITLSAQGVKNSINLSTGALVSGTYNNNIANLIALIVTQYGKASTKFTAADLDLTNLADFASANTQSVGIYITDRSNVLNVCKELASSIGAQLFVTRLGKLQLLKYGVGNTASSEPITITTITDSDILINTLEISNRLSVNAATKLGYCKNWTVQADLVTAIPQEDKNNFSEEWLTVTNVNSTVKTNYKMDSDPVQKDTLLIVDSEALAEASRLTTFYSQKRTVYKFTGTAKLLALQLGQSVSLVHDRFDLYNSGNGRIGQVVGLTPNWSKQTVEVEVLI